jgi:biopolymer transport protein ExbB
MWEIVRAGGPFIWPIILCSVALVGIVLERLWTLQRKRVLPEDLIKKVSELAERNQVNPKVIEALEKNSPLGRVLAAALANRHRGRDIMMERVEDVGRHVVHELERFVNSVGTIASISPLLGLLGTVTGIIGAFNAVMLGGMGDPRMLAGGISEALVCTAAGLTVAMLMRTNPSLPSTSMAVTTDWCVERASARTVTGLLRSAPATSRMAARKVSGEALMSSRSLTR